MLAVAGCALNVPGAEPVYFPPPPSAARIVHLRSFNRLSELVPHRRSLLDLLRGRAADPYVGTPAGVAYRDGRLYICDTDLNAVHVWNLGTGEAKRIGSSGDVELAKPVDVAVDDAGRVYVADTGRGEVVAFDAAGRSLPYRFRPPGRDHYKPVSVAATESKIYVTDVAGHRVDVFATGDGAHLESFGRIGVELGRLYYPTGVALNGAGNVLVSDMMNARVQVFDSRHEPVVSMGRPGNRYGDMGKPRHLAVGPDSVVFIADVEFRHVHLFNARGQLLMLLGGPDNRPGGTPMPVGVAVAGTLPDQAAALTPGDFEASYYVFVANSTGSKRISLFAVGSGRTGPAM
jgi:DNA-binding beta-propeller fold protein YncE